jgi:hypothetical protein
MVASHRSQRSGIVLLVILVFGAVVASQPIQASPLRQPLPEEDPLVQDAQQLAQDMRLPVEEVLWRLDAQERVGGAGRGYR